MEIYLVSPPLLVSPSNAKELLVYFHVSDHALSTVLVKEEGGNQMSMYYVSRVLQTAEKNYTKAEKLVFVLIMAARKLRQYFQSYHIVVITNQPIKDILQKVSTSWRMLK